MPEKDDPEGCIACNKEAVEAYLMKNGVFSMDKCLTRITEIPKKLKATEEVIPICEICGAQFVIDWAKSDIDN